MSHVVVHAGEAGNEKVAQGLLAVAAGLGLDLAVVEWSPSLGGFKVPEEVAAAYAGTQDPDATPEADEPAEATAPAAPAEPPKPWTVAAASAAAETSGPRRYSDEEKAAAVAAVAEGKSIASVAEDLGASATSVSNWVAAAKKAEEGANTNV